MTEYRASFDAAITFSNGGDLAVHGFRVDLPSPDTSEAGIAALFVASLGLLMTDAVELSNVTIIAEPHKGTRGGPADRAAPGPDQGGRLVELSHVILPGMVTSPGLPGNTGTYLCAPYHRFPGSADLAAIALARTAGILAAVIRVTGARQREISVGALAAVDVRGKAVLLHTGDDARSGTPQYAEDAHFLTRDGAAWLAGQDPALVGIDAVSVDDTADGERPALTLLLAAGIPVIENLTGLEQLPPAGASFTAVPLRIQGLGIIPVRAFARLLA
jgi:arylformamidase